jgi:hypothetical protein
MQPDKEDPVSRSFVSRALMALVMGISLAPTLAGAAQPEDCPQWFPDFRCDRQGRYEGFTMPVTMPFLFEEPFNTTNVSVHVVHHQFPDDSIIDGGHATVLAVQARVAITDRLAFIATKDGYVWFRPGHDLLRDQQGFFDITAGLKYVLIDRPEDNFILSPMVRFDMPTGSSGVFSGNGDGVIIPSVAWAWGWGDFHIVSHLGGRVPFDGDKESTSLFYNFHLDYVVQEHFVPFVELNGTHWTSSGDGTLDIRTRIGVLPLGVVQGALGHGRGEGNDVVNLGSQGVAGNDIVSMAVGARFPITKHIHAAFAFEFPVTSREDLLKQRSSVNLTYEF